LVILGLLTKPTKCFWRKIRNLAWSGKWKSIIFWLCRLKHGSQSDCLRYNQAGWKTSAAMATKSQQKKQNVATAMISRSMVWKGLIFFFPDRWIYKKQFKLVSCRISVCNFTLHRVGGVTLPLNCNILHCFKSSFGGILILTISNHPIYISIY
jgi:hypothetical protein